MDLKFKKIFLEIYGVLRMILGVGQIVGLFSGYFLLEWVARYPSQGLYVIHEESLALVCLIVLLKGVFHVVAGIGIARFKLWARVWIFYGWIVMAFMTYSVVSHLAQHWIDAGFIKHVSQIFLASRIIIYLAFIVFDCVIVGSFIKDVDGSFETLEPTNMRLDGKKISSLLIMGAIFFMILLLFGRPIQKGFHQGYYKLKEGSTRITKSYQPSSRGITAVVKEQKLSEQKVPLEMLEAQRIAIVVESPKAENKKEPLKTVLEPMKKEIRKEIPYRNVFGILGGFLIFMGLLFQAFQEKKGDESSAIPMDYILLSIGFLLWVVYGLSLKQAVFAFMNVVIFLLCVIVIFSQFKQE
ncbi:MAG TPA: hypothetical protein PLH56_03230 [Candidatus Omnitrophota bacterium]|nr:hypothetical protein [Candidatus Omnitrophota bacterium]